MKKLAAFCFVCVILSPLVSLAQKSITINGVVNDNKGGPLPGASIQVRGKSSGTTSDNEGSFRIKLQPGMYANVELGMDMGEGLVVPASAVMPTGSREIAFVDKGGGKLEARVVELGQQIGDQYEVKSGLAEGERVIASANFLIDAESKVQGALKDFEPTVNR